MQNDSVDTFSEIRLGVSWSACSGLHLYRDTSLIRNRLHSGPYRSICLGSYGGPRGGGSFLWAMFPCSYGPVRQACSRKARFERYRVTSLIRNSTPPYGRHMALGIVLL
jgi:hypothetical protein